MKTPVRRLFLKPSTFFTEQNVGKGNADLQFNLVRKYENLKIPFRWTWQHYECESCNYKKQEIKIHSIYELGVYEAVDKSRYAEAVWIGLTEDNRMMAIPQARRAEVAKHLEHLEPNAIS